MRGLGEIKTLCNIVKPDVGVITNIGTTHLELLLTQERIAQAKWELIESLRKTHRIINAEDIFSVQKRGMINIQSILWSGRYFCRSTY
jgi:UDP-N-acetylmuramoyl-tripeptide--D-alanyl-D-alanine ligase